MDAVHGGPQRRLERAARRAATLSVLPALLAGVAGCGGAAADSAETRTPLGRSAHAICASAHASARRLSSPGARRFDLRAAVFGEAAIVAQALAALERVSPSPHQARAYSRFLAEMRRFSRQLARIASAYRRGERAAMARAFTRLAPERLMRAAAGAGLGACARLADMAVP